MTVSEKSFPGTTRHWISTEMFTVQVNTDSTHRIVWAAPIVRKFIGSPIGDLLNWSIRFGGLRHEILPAPKETRP